MIGAVDLGVIVAYFALVIGFGAWAARHSRSTRDFFLGGQRFSWWIVGVSCVATVVGSYSFVKYSAAGFQYGLSSSQTYLNDWFWMPLWMFGWLPIIYYARITSVPEYFERRFGPHAQRVATALLLAYLCSYLGYNFWTIGVALEGLTGWNAMWAAAFAALVCGVYTAHGGQTAVIFTDLLQGVILLVGGVLLFVLGLAAVGGLGEFWQALGPEGRRVLPPMAEDPNFNFVGIFWQDGFVGGIAFYFMNQGILLRFLSARSVGEARKAAGFVLLFLMPVAAIAVSGAGWIGRAMASKGIAEVGGDPSHVFMDVASVILPVGLFGFVAAALLAALMSTADTLINAVGTIAIVDLWRPWRRARGRALDERSELLAARIASGVAAVLGIGLVPLFASFKSIYRAHGTFTAAVTPPLAVALLLGFVWPRFSGRAAMLVMLGGSGAMAASFVWPELVEPFSHGIVLEPGAKSYSYIRAFYGLIVCTALGVIGTLIWPRRGPHPGTLVLGPMIEKMRFFKGGQPRVGKAPRLHLRLAEAEASAAVEDSALEQDESVSEARRLANVVLGAEDAARAHIEDGDVVTLWSTGLFRGAYQAVTGQAVIAPQQPAGQVAVPARELERVRLRAGSRVHLQRIL